MMCLNRVMAAFVALLQVVYASEAFVVLPNSPRLSQSKALRSGFASANGVPADSARGSWAMAAAATAAAAAAAASARR
eukprot:CAMPEP_0180471982 /NCGR_PEP_ID=MMETSP1036_2-20121128/29401_1 /TAXON_ID=632150 /ORGANISM="Azadinium spinosum, Strain 3D9" /LENGTH=77 /DNA_ID=CAMNT_0022479203 /DNA_START=80 /DNA_END=310 /DNA_ORIENTATION=+